MLESIPNDLELTLSRQTKLGGKNLGIQEDRIPCPYVLYHCLDLFLSSRTSCIEIQHQMRIYWPCCVDGRRENVLGKTCQKTGDRRKFL